MAWFNGENKDNKSKTKLTTKKGMLGDELSKAEKLGKQLRYREEDFAEEKEAEAWIEDVKKEAASPQKTVQKSSPFPAKRNSLREMLRPEGEEEQAAVSEQVGNDETVKKPGVQLSSPFPPRRGSSASEQKVVEEPKKPSVQLSSPFPPRRGGEVSEQKVVEEPKKPSVQLSSPFPPRRGGEMSEQKVVEEPKKPSIQLSSPFPPRRGGEVSEQKVVDEPKKPSIQLSSPFPPRRGGEVSEQKVVEESKKPNVQLSSPFPPKKVEVAPVEQPITKQETKEEATAWEPVAPWMQSVSTRSDVVDRSSIPVQTSKPSLRELAKDIIKSAPKEIIIDLPKENIREENQYTNVYKTLDETSEKVIAHEENRGSEIIYEQEMIQAYEEVEVVEDHEEVEDIETAYHTELEIDFSQMFTSVSNIVEEEVTGEQHFAQEVAYGIEDTYAVEDGYEDHGYQEHSDYGFPEDPLGLNQMFDLSSIGTVEVEEDGILLGSEDATIEEVAITEEPLVVEAIRPIQHMVPVQEVPVQKVGVQESYAVVTAKVSIHFSEDRMDILNNTIGNAIILLNSVGEKYDFSITKEAEGGQNLNLSSTAEAISKVMTALGQVVAKVSIHFNEEDMGRLNSNVGNVIMALNSGGEKYDFSITKDKVNGQNLNLSSTAEVISKVMALFK